MIMEPYDVYRAYLSLRLHFTTDSYDVIKQQGRVKASKQSFFKRRDLFSIKKISELYTDKEVVDFLVANFVSGDRWGGVFDHDAKETYMHWKKRIESMTYIFEKEVDNIFNFAEKTGITYLDMFVAKNKQHPHILKLYLKGTVSIETLVILNKLNNYVEQLDTFLDTDVIWPDVSRIIKKYSPFLSINKEKYDNIVRRRIGCN